MGPVGPIVGPHGKFMYKIWTNFSEPIDLLDFFLGGFKEITHRTKTYGPYNYDYIFKEIIHCTFTYVHLHEQPPVLIGQFPGLTGKLVRSCRYGHENFTVLGNSLAHQEHADK